MRRYHRIISFAAGIFLFLITVSGVLLHVREFLEEEEHEDRKPAHNLASGIPEGWTLALNKGLAAIYAKDANVQVKRIRIDVEDEKPRLVVQTGGENAINYVLSENGTILRASKPEKNLLLRLHTGEILGDAGEGLNLIMGLALLGLLLTGGVLIWQMIAAAPSVGEGVKRVLGIK
jgi:uncharacterized iron-regulated membrane protein